MPDIENLLREELKSAAQKIQPEVLRPLRVRPALQNELTAAGGTESSNPSPSSGESGANSISWIMVAADARMRVSGVPPAGRSCSTSWCSSQGQRGDDRNRVDVGRFLPEIPRPPKTPRHCHDIRCRGADHVDLAVAKRQFGATAGRRDDATAHLVPD